MRYAEERLKVVNTARKMYQQGLVIGTWGNVSIRLPDGKGMMITPSGMEYARLTPGDMVAVDGEGTVIEGKWKPSTETVLHLRIYSHRPGVGAVVHVHSTAASAFAVAGVPIPVVLEETAQLLGGPVAVAPYAMCGTESLADRAVQALEQGSHAVLLANHGLVGLGDTADTALKVCLVAEKTAQVALYAHILGRVNSLSAEQIMELKTAFEAYGATKLP